MSRWGKHNHCNLTHFKESERHLPCRVVNFILSCESEKRECGVCVEEWRGWELGKSKAQRVDSMRKGEGLQRSQVEQATKEYSWVSHCPSLGFRWYLELPKSSLLCTLPQEPGFLLRCSFYYWHQAKLSVRGLRDMHQGSYVRVRKLRFETTFSLWFHISFLEFIQSGFFVTHQLRPLSSYTVSFLLSCCSLKPKGHEMSLLFLREVISPTLLPSALE